MADEREMIIAELERVRAMLYKNEQLFNITADSDAAEALIYERQALMSRYGALITKAKEYSIKGDVKIG